MNKTLESLQSKKFDVKHAGIVGGAPSYGPYYNTTNGQKDPYGTMDEARTTYNADNKPQPNSGQDDICYNS